MSFEKRIQRTIENGRKRSEVREVFISDVRSSSRKLEMKHSDLRSDLVEYFGFCASRIVKHFPEFRMRMIVSDDGWGTVLVARHAASKNKMGSVSQESSLELLVPQRQLRPVLELKTTAIIRGKEVFLRTHFVPLRAVDFGPLCQVIEKWCLEFVELYVTLR